MVVDLTGIYMDEGTGLYVNHNRLVLAGTIRRYIGSHGAMLLDALTMIRWVLIRISSDIL